MAPNTDNRLTRDLMLEAVPNSSANILLTLEIWSFGGIIKEIILVPFLQIRKQKRIINFISNSTKIEELRFSDIDFWGYMFQKSNQFLADDGSQHFC